MVLSRLHQELETCTEFKFCVAFATREAVMMLFQQLLELGQRGVYGKVVLSQYLNFTEPGALLQLLKLPHIDLRINTQDNLHAKGYWFAHEGGESLIVGSSNWTATALKVNSELNVRLPLTSSDLLAQEFSAEFDRLYRRSTPVDKAFIETYIKLHREVQRTVVHHQSLARIAADRQLHWAPAVQPNSMQQEALDALAALRARGETRALIVSATGTGKTFLSAFDAAAVRASKLLFVVHRENIARAAMQSFERVFQGSRSLGLYTGNERNIDADFVFSTVQTLSRPQHLQRFGKDAFDYIIVDESHRAGAASYAKFLDHFNPGFLLGMTATPERTDGADIFKYFHYNIPFEVRLQRALEEGMVCPFHYFGIQDLTINGESVEDDSAFSRLVAEERVARILEQISLYGTCDPVVRGLVFCSRVEEAKELAHMFQMRGRPSLALSGSTPEEERERAIQRLEAPVEAVDRLDFLFSVDVFNEGVDIPSCNMVVLLRPTQSAIVFVQQLGRGLRRIEGQEKYLTVLDFIGSYKGNFLIPAALFGDRSYDKDQLRRLLATGNPLIPGTSTISFDRVSKEQVFEAISSASTDALKNLRSDFQAMKARIGRLPMMCDFFEHDGREAFAFARSSGSYYAFAQSMEPTLVPALPRLVCDILEIHARDALNGRCAEEPVLLQLLLKHVRVTRTAWQERVAELSGEIPTRIRWNAACRSLDLRFFRLTHNRQMVDAATVLGVELFEYSEDSIAWTQQGQQVLSSPTLRAFWEDMASYAVLYFTKNLRQSDVYRGFVRGRKYARMDVFRVLGAESNPVAQNVGGYLIAPDQQSCPIFVTYHKDEDIASTVKYEDTFMDPSSMRWFTKNGRNLESPDARFFRKPEGARIPLFVQKNNDEGRTFYYVGDVTPDPNSFLLEWMPSALGKKKSVVTMTLRLDRPVEAILYAYLTSARS